MKHLTSKRVSCAKNLEEERLPLSSCLSFFNSVTRPSAGHSTNYHSSPAPPRSALPSQTSVSPSHVPLLLLLLLLLVLIILALPRERADCSGDALPCAPLTLSARTMSDSRYRRPSIFTRASSSSSNNNMVNSNTSSGGKSFGRRRHQHSQSASSHLITAEDLSPRPELSSRHSTSSSVSIALPHKLQRDKQKPQTPRDSFDEPAGSRQLHHHHNNNPFTRTSKLFSSTFSGFKPQPASHKDKSEPGLVSPASSSHESSSPPATPYSTFNSSTPCLVAAPGLTPDDGSDELLVEQLALAVDNDTGDGAKSAPPQRRSFNTSRALDGGASDPQQQSRWRRSFFSPFTSSSSSKTSSMKPSKSGTSLKKSASNLSLALVDVFQTRESIAEERSEDEDEDDDSPVLAISNPRPVDFDAFAQHHHHHDQQPQPQQEISAPAAERGDTRPTSMVSTTSQTSATSSLLRDPPSSAQILTVQAVHKFDCSSPIKTSLATLVADEFQRDENVPPRGHSVRPRDSRSKLKRSESARLASSANGHPSASKPIQAPDTAVSLSAHMHERQRKLSRSASKLSLSPRSRANSMKRDLTRSQSQLLQHKKNRTEGGQAVEAFPLSVPGFQQQQQQPLSAIERLVEEEAHAEPMSLQKQQEQQERPPLHQSTASEDAVLTMAGLESRSHRRRSDES